MAERFSGPQTNAGLRRFERCWKNIRETSRQEALWTWISSMTLNEDLWTIGYLPSLDRLCGGHMGFSAEFQFVCFVANLLCMWSAIAPLLEDGCPNAQCEDRFRRTSMILLPGVVSILPLWIGASNSAWRSGQVFTDRIYHCILIVYASITAAQLPEAEVHWCFLERFDSQNLYIWSTSTEVVLRVVSAFFSVTLARISLSCGLDEASMRWHSEEPGEPGM